jgi:hypothetical protein
MRVRKMSVMKEHYAAKSAAFYDRYYKQLEGATITKFDGVIEITDGEGFPAFQVTLANGQVIDLEVSSDPEGNGGGFLFGLPWVDMSDWTKKTALLQKAEEENNA